MKHSGVATMHMGTHGDASDIGARDTLAVASECIPAYARPPSIGVLPISLPCTQNRVAILGLAGRVTPSAVSPLTLMRATYTRKPMRAQACWS